ncbi:chorismate mutase / prephenate dehydratase [Mariprofundus micogutta]|uniref:Bifunctional chorismate mutase/prephenate dehydratase n=1 Tax=Mariprofundus micogutta TaxID=1921010 RepID=A0A1L8CLH7_9PROT|nr:prephenate dehydratase [Mariprofundus micogutta]GAV19763.1 chorismate mutase / prephenate dehydratase [Mariprofundus micogutta]
MGDLEAKLSELRAAIDAADDEILDLIRKRARLAGQVGEAKQNKGNVPFYVPSREASIIRRLLSRNTNAAESSHETKIPDEAIHGIYREIIGACLALEHPMTIAYLGPEGTFSHTAATRQFGATPKYLPCSSLELVFDEVEAGRATYGVVPVENAFEGAVTPTLDLFADMERDVFICAEVQLSIHHHLFTYAESLDDIEVVISHPQPLGQCRNWLASHLPNAQLMESSSTMRAAQIVDEARVSESGALDWKKCAVIGPYSIVDKSELSLVQRNIEDFHDNTTRFFVIGQHDSPASGEDKTSLVMSIKDEPGALHNLMTSFAGRGIGLTRIESRPSKKKLWEYVFFADVQGHRDDVAVTDAIDEIQSKPGGFIKVLGSYPVSKPL